MRWCSCCGSCVRIQPKGWQYLPSGPLRIGKSPLAHRAAATTLRHRSSDKQGLVCTSGRQPLVDQV